MLKRFLFAVLCMVLIVSVGCSSTGTNEPPTGTENVSETEAPENLVDPSTLVDFVVEVPADRDPIVLQLTDPQIIDAAQSRTADRLSDTAKSNWATDQVENCCYQYIRETIQVTNPDFIMITGDVVYGEFDDNGTALQGFVAFMESFQIPWSPVFGNHDNESKKGVDWQCEQFENSQYCLFKQRELTGNGNYSVGIVQDGVLKRAFYMLDSNSCAGASEESLANGHTQTTVGFGEDQINWFTESITALKEQSPNTKISFAFHIQLAVFQDAYAQYGFDNLYTAQKPINIDRLTNKAATDFGYLGANLKTPWDKDQVIWQGMKALGVDSVFVGHEHSNSASVIYDGVRFQFGQKSSTYDRNNYYIDKGNGFIITAYESEYIPLIGGTVIPLSRDDGSIQEPYIYLCENAGGAIFNQAQ